MSSVDFERKLRELLDKQEITEALVRYCRGVDRLDAEMINSVFHPDALDDHGFSGAEAGSWLVNRMKTNYDASLHSVTNVLIELDGDVARCESHCLVLHIHHQPPKLLGEVSESTVIRRRYLRLIDRFERRKGEWKIARRQVVLEAGQNFASSPRLGAWKQPSLRSREDVSYSRE